MTPQIVKNLERHYDVIMTLEGRRISPHRLVKSGPAMEAMQNRAKGTSGLGFRAKLHQGQEAFKGWKTPLSRPFLKSLNFAYVRTHKQTHTHEHT